MSNLLHKITKDVTVGIYDNSEYVANVYTDKIIVTTPYVKWAGNSGGYAERKESIRDQRVIDAIIKEITDDAEDTAWELIGAELNDDYLRAY